MPEEIANQLNLAPGEIPRRVLEAIVLEGYRSDKLSREQVGELLHLDAHKTEPFLAERPAPSPSLPDTSVPEADPDWEAFREALPQLLETDRGNYVAIFNGRIIDRDPDQFALSERVSCQHSGQRVRIQRVVEGGLEDIFLDTPEAELALARGLVGTQSQPLDQRTPH